MLFWRREGVRRPRAKDAAEFFGVAKVGPTLQHLLEGVLRTRDGVVVLLDFGLVVTLNLGLVECLESCLGAGTDDCASTRWLSSC